MNNLQKLYDYKTNVLDIEPKISQNEYFKIIDQIRSRPNQYSKAPEKINIKRNSIEPFKDPDVISTNKRFNLKIDTILDEPTKENIDKKNLVNHTFTRTYNINHIAYSNSEEFLYSTIREFQGEEIETVKVERKMFQNANVGDNFEITFTITNNNIEDNIKSIFNNSKVTKAVKTDKTGLEQVCDPIE